MTPKRLENIAFVFMVLTAMTVYSAVKTRPILTSKLIVALVFALCTYGLMVWKNHIERKNL